MIAAVLPFGDESLQLVEAVRQIEQELLAGLASSLPVSDESIGWAISFIVVPDESVRRSAQTLLVVHATQFTIADTTPRIMLPDSTPRATFADTRPRVAVSQTVPAVRLSDTAPHATIPDTRPLVTEILVQHVD